METRPAKRRRLCRIPTSNIFEQFSASFGERCYVDSAPKKKLRQKLYRLVNDNGGYRDVIRQITQQALAYHTENADVLKVDPEVGRETVCAAVGCLHLALHVCQRYAFHDDPANVKEIIRRITQADGGFDRFMMFLDPLSFTFEIDQTLFPPKPSETNSKSGRHLQALRYFLRYGNQLKVTMQFTEFDFVGHDGMNALNTFKNEVEMVNCPVINSRGSTPLLLACHSLEPKSVLLLLRYGADPLRPGQLHHIIGLHFQHPLYVLVTKLNASVFWRSHNRHLEKDIHEQFLSKQDQQDDNLRRCLRYLCRALPNLPVTTRPGSSNKSSSLPGERPTFQLHKHFEDLLPKTRTTQPAELSQWCRCTIRQVLCTCGQLPDGVDKLPLPSLLKQFLDLLLD